MEEQKELSPIRLSRDSSNVEALEPEAKRPGDVEERKKEVTENVATSQAKPPKLKLVTNSPYPPRDPEGARERDRLEKERMEKCWQGDDWREKQGLSDYFEREERLKIFGKRQ